jgi:hypothetical protein
MTVVNYLTKTELPDAFNTGNLDASSQQAVINQLINDGLYTSSTPDDGKSIWVESDIYQGVLQPPLFDSLGNPAVPAFVQALEVEGSNVTVQTDTTLQIIVDDGNNANNLLTVTGGGNPEFIALGKENYTVNLNDTGNDTVLGGSSGNDSITANTGHDQLIAGGGVDNLIDLLSGGADTLVAGPGPDTITGLQGDQFLLPSSASASSNDVYNVYDGGGNSTVNLGSGADSVNFYTTAGNDTITNGGGVDTVNYMASSTNYLTDIKSITPGTGAQSGDYLVKFTDGQSVDLIGHSESASKVAFTLEFKDGTLNLKGGS